MLTKTDFMNYLECPMYLWLSKHRRELLPKDTPEKERIFAMGRQVDELAKKLFSAGIEAQGYNEQGWENTKKAIAGGAEIIFQPTAVSGNIGCRADILVKNKKDNTWDIHEVKMATKVKKEYIFDVGFQRICFENAGITISSTHLVHINSDYVRKGEINPRELFAISDITDEVNRKLPEIQDEIERALVVADWKEDHYANLVNGCHNAKNCEYIEYFCKENPKVYSFSSVLLPQTLLALLDRNILDYRNVPADILQAVGYELEQEFTEINALAIKKEFEKLQYPLYFFDYETYNSPIPPFDGVKPYQQIPFQYSLMIQDNPTASVRHTDFLMKKFENPMRDLLSKLEKDIGPTGSIIVWFALFESKRNEEMAEQEPEFIDFLKSVNERMFDLMLIFKFKNKMYIKSEFKKLASLKIVLPVLCPELSYSSLAIQEGGTASASWPILTNGVLTPHEKIKLENDMLEYCKRDTQAMVSILHRVYKDIE